MPRSKTALPGASLLMGRRTASLPWRLRLSIWKMRLVATRFRNWILVITGKLPTNTLRVFLYRHVFRLKIASGARIEPGCIIWGPSRITIGAGTIINRGVILDGRFPLTIGENVSVSMQSAILTLEHDLNDPGFQSVGGPVTIGDRAFLGLRSIILPGIKIGEGAAVGVGAVVTRDVEPYSIVAGAPARAIGARSRHLTYTFHSES